MAKKLYKALDTTAGILAVVGAINWLLVVINWNAVEKITNALGFAILSTIIYTLVGLSGLWIVGRAFAGKFMR